MTPEQATGIIVELQRKLAKGELDIPALEGDQDE